jgi:hypothetical protein
VKKHHLRHALVPLLLVMATLVLILLGPIPQDQAYHRFEDSRTILGIPNFFDVITNLPFLFIGLLGLSAARGQRPVSMRRICTVLFLGFVLLAFGSGYYHWRPWDGSLVLDRIPIAIIFMSFFCIILHDHVGEWYGGWALLPLNLLGIYSVVSWYMGERMGTGDLRTYILVQFFPLLAMPLLVWLHPSRHQHRRHLVWIYLFFILARAGEAWDAEIYHALNGLLGGHALKHVFMALAGFQVLRMVRQRSTGHPTGPVFFGHGGSA